MKKLYLGKSDIEGTGLFVEENVREGEFISFIEGTERIKKSISPEDALTIPTWYGVSKTKWIDPGNGLFSFLNHNCNPNTAIVGTKKLIARRNIKKNEEISIDYSMTDGDLLWSMQCSCRHRQCRKEIRSIQTLPRKYFDNHFPLIPKYFTTLYKKYNKF